MKNESASSGLMDGIWKFFASVKLTVAVLLSLAATSIIGTLIPQNQDPVQYFRTFGEFYYRIFHVLDIFDMYHAWWFQLLLILLALNVIVCSMDRLSATWKIVFVKNPSFQLSRFRKISDPVAYTTPQVPGRLEELYLPVVSKHFSHSRTEKTDRGTCILAEKGRWTRLGVYAVHLSIVLLLAGGLLGSIFGFEGFVNIPEGETINAIRLRNGNAAYPLGFEIRCDKFSIHYYASGMPSEYRSTVTILRQGRAVLKKDIIVNDPLRFGGISLYQSSYGALAPKEITLSFNSVASGMTYRKTVHPGQVVNLQENMGTFVVRDFQNAFRFRGQNVGETFFGTLTGPDKNAVDIVLPVRYSNFDKMRKGPVVISVVDYKSRYYTGLQVTRDPGVWVVYVGFILMIVGCMVTFFMSHQRFCVEIVADKNRTAVTVSGFANKNKLGMQAKVKKISKQLRKLDPLEKEAPPETRTP